MNFRKLIYYLITIYVIFSLTKAVYAQREISDYNYQYEKYQQQYKGYQTAKNEFLKHQTLASQNEAINQTKSILSQRGQLLRTYFLALKFKLNTTTGVTNTEKATLTSVLDDEIGWLQNHIDDLADLNNPTLTQLFEISKRLEKKERDYRTLAYKSLATVIVAKSRNLHQQMLVSNSVLKSYVEKSKAGFMQNWLKEAEDSVYKASEAIIRAEEITQVEIAKNSSKIETSARTYAQVQDELENCQRLLLKASGFQKEIVRELNRSLMPVNTGQANTSSQSAVINSSPEASASSKP